MVTACVQHLMRLMNDETLVYKNLVIPLCQQLSIEQKKFSCEGCQGQLSFDKSTTGFGCFFVM